MGQLIELLATKKGHRIAAIIDESIPANAKRSAKGFGFPVRA